MTFSLQLNTMLLSRTRFSLLVELVTLYMKIDANSDGSVDWSEFIEYMLLENKGAELMREAELEMTITKVYGNLHTPSLASAVGSGQEPRQPEDPSAEQENGNGAGMLPQTPKRDCHVKKVTVVKYFNGLKSYVTCGHDSQMKVWSLSRTSNDYAFRLVKTIKTPPSITLSLKKGMKEQAIGSMASDSLNTNEKSGKQKAGHSNVVKKRTQVSSWTHKFKNVAQKKTIVDDYAASTAWAEDVEFMSKSKILVAACSNRTLNFYEARGFTLVGRLRPLKHPPLCLAYAAVEDGQDDMEVLVCGDMSGAIHVWQLKPQKWWFPDNTHHTKRNEQQCGVIRKFTLKAHTDCITHLTYVPDLGMIVAGSLDATVSLLSPFKVQEKETGRFFTKHVKAVHCLTYLHSKKAIISAGRDRTIKLWNPYTLTMIHEIPAKYFESWILQLQVIPCFQLLAVLTGRSKIILFDLSSYELRKTVYLSQTNAPTTELLETHYASTFIYSPRKRMLICFNPEVHAYQFSKQERLSRTTTHSYAVAKVLYNKKFQQVVTVAGPEVSLWNLFTGELLFKFLAKRTILQACFDRGKRRLVTGSIEGTVDIWNFNNGARLGSFRASASTLHSGECPQNRLCEIGLLSLAVMSSDPMGEVSGDSPENCNKKEYFVAAGWSEKICVFQDRKKLVDNEVLCMPLNSVEQLRKAHSKDALITAMTFLPPKALVTGCDKGRIIIWSLESGYVRSELKDDCTSGSLAGVSCFLVCTLSAATYILSCHFNGFVKIWEAASTQIQYSFSVEENGAGDNIAVDYATVLASVSSDYLSSGNNTGCGIAANADSATLIVGQATGKVTFYELRSSNGDEGAPVLSITSSLLCSFRPHTDMITAVQAVERSALLSASSAFIPPDCSSGNNCAYQEEEGSFSCAEKGVFCLLTSSLDQVVKLSIAYLSPGRSREQSTGNEQKYLMVDCIGFFGSDKVWDLRKQLKHCTDTSEKGAEVDSTPVDYMEVEPSIAVANSAKRKNSEIASTTSQIRQGQTDCDTRVTATSPAEAGFKKADYEYHSYERCREVLKKRYGLHSFQDLLGKESAVAAEAVLTQIKHLTGHRYLTHSRSVPSLLASRTAERQDLFLSFSKARLRLNEDIKPK